MPPAAVSALRSQGWPARLELGFDHAHGRTRLARRRHEGPLMVQRPFYPEAGGTCHLYLLHPPGGVVGGDVLEVDLGLASRASALLTTPAATKVYRTRGAPAVARQTARVEPEAVLEWLPQETIVFGGSHYDAVSRVELEPGAHYLGWEIMCLGRPASSDGFLAGSVEQRTELHRSGRPLVVDHCRVEAESAARKGVWGWGGRSVYATFLATGASEALVRAVRAGIEPRGTGDLVSVSALGEVLACRFLGSSAATAKATLGVAWNIVRREVLGKPACPPRIWAT